VDGVIEINEATAAAGGVTSGDLAGYPVTLSQMGSYRLTSNLMLPSADTTGIQVTSPKVTVDLNGFAIMGPVKCEGTPPQVECTPAGGGSGIFSVGNDHVTVLNGTVSGTGRAGILVNGAGTRIERVHVSNNGGDGVFAGFYCLAHAITARSNGGDGIETGDNCTVSGSVADSNAESGISTGGSTTISGNTTTRNDSGILARGGCTVVDNTAASNVNEGLRLNSIAGYGRNVLTTNNGNTFGSNANPEVSGGIEIAPNLCGSDTICP
jgi:hypothetical protein